SGLPPSGAFLFRTACCPASAAAGSPSPLRSLPRKRPDAAALPLRLLFPIAAALRPPAGRSRASPPRGSPFAAPRQFLRTFPSRAPAALQTCRARFPATASSRLSQLPQSVSSPVPHPSRFSRRPRPAAGRVLLFRRPGLQPRREFSTKDGL